MAIKRNSFNIAEKLVAKEGLRVIDRLLVGEKNDYPLPKNVFLSLWKASET